MTNRWLKGVAIVALMAVGTVVAQAADLPTRKEAPAPVFVPPPFTWTGFYIGVNAGGIWPSGGRSASIFDPHSGRGATHSGCHWAKGRQRSNRCRTRSR